MNIRIRFYLAIIVLFIAQSLFAQKEAFSPYYQIKRKYENRSENDTTALPLVSAYIRLAKEVEDYPRLVEGYQDGIFYSLNDSKLKYADSAVHAAQLSQDENLMGRTHLSRGTVYYFNFKKYKLALDEFLKAYEYAKKGDDQYYLNKVAYRLAVVKSYIGYYDQALILFKQTKEFFKKESERKTHVNLQYGNKRGYYNSLHQMTICYRNLGRQKTADSITEIGLSLTCLNKDFRQEYGYFLKEKGISEFYKHKYVKSIRTLKSSREYIANVNDFAWMAVCYSYIGKSYMALGDMKQAFPYLQKVDSVFKRNHFVLPELRSNYEELIFHYQRERNTLKELYYTRQLLRADSIIREDFPYLAAKIFKEYDERKLLDQKMKLETTISRSYLLNFTLLAVAGLLVLALYTKYKEKQKIREQYKVLEQKILSQSNSIVVETEQAKTNYKLDIDQKTVDEVLKKLKIFEEKVGFTEPGLTLHKLASKLETNHTYLSNIIREYKGVHFARYLGEMRIAYITEKLYNDKKYLNYTLETLAIECGIGSRNTFAALFLEINGIRATDFIRERLRKLDK